MAVGPITIWHNPRCTKSRETLALLQAHGVTPSVRLYLENPPDRAELAALAEKLGARAMLRWKDADLAKDAPDDAILDALAANPKLIERPVVIHGTQARIGRPPDAVLDIL